MMAKPNLSFVQESPRTSFHTGQRVIIAYLMLTPLLSLVIVLILYSYGYSPIKITLALGLLILCGFPSVQYLASREDHLPALPLLCLAYALQFAVPILTNEPKLRLSGGYISELGDEQVIPALLLSFLGVLFLLIGHQCVTNSRLLKSIKPLKFEVDRDRALFYCVIVGAAAPLLVAIQTNLRESIYFTQLSALFWVLQNQTLVVIAILARLVFTGKVSKWLYLVLLIILFFSILQGIASGGLEQAIVPIATFLIARWQTTKKIPVAIILISVLILIFFSPTKADFRQDVWYGRNEEVSESNSQVEKAQYWIKQSANHWSDVLSGEKKLGESTEVSTSRLDLIHQFSHIYSMTPEVIPFQMGGTYTYFLVAFIPRFIWPDKPEVGSANRFFAVGYRITTEEGARRTTFGVSLLAESFVNFSWYGVIFIMAIQGGILALLQHFFAREISGIGAQAVFVAFFVYFLNGVGTSAEVLFGNIFQSLIFNLILLRWLRVRTGNTIL